MFAERRYTYVRNYQFTGCRFTGGPAHKSAGDPVPDERFPAPGTITGFDSFVVVLVTDGKQQMIYKHAISTLVPIRPLKAAETTA